jgi:membrane peptidoglycan carboxypeptidase
MFPDHIELESKSNWRGVAGAKPPFYRRAWFLTLLALTIVGAIAGFITFILVVEPLKEKAESFDLNELRKLESASIILDRNGEELFRLYMLNRTPVSSKKSRSTWWTRSSPRRTLVTLVTTVWIIRASYALCG